MPLRLACLVTEFTACVSKGCPESDNVRVSGARGRQPKNPGRGDRSCPKTSPSLPLCLMPSACSCVVAAEGALKNRFRNGRQCLSVSPAARRTCEPRLHRYCPIPAIAKSPAANSTNVAGSGVSKLPAGDRNPESYKASPSLGHGYPARYSVGISPGMVGNAGISVPPP
jgi:hypothetical protein